MSLGFSAYDFAPVVLICDDTAFFAEALGTKLSSKSCKVVKTSASSSDAIFDTRSGTKTVSGEEFQKHGGRKYIVVFLNNFDKRQLSGKNKFMRKVLATAVKNDAKILFVFPFKQRDYLHTFFDYWHRKLLALSDLYGGVVYYGELFELPEFGLNSLVEKNQLVKTKTVYNFHPIPIGLLANFVERALFSTRVYKQSVAYVGNKQSFEKVTNVFFYLNPKIKIVNKNILFVPPSEVDDYLQYEGDFSSLLVGLSANLNAVNHDFFKLFLVKTASFLKSSLLAFVRPVKLLIGLFTEDIRQRSQSFEVIEKQSPKVRGVAFINYKRLRMFFFLVLVLLFAPFVLFYLSLGTLFVSNYQFSKNNFYIGEVTSDVTYSVSTVGKDYAKLFLNQPRLSSYYENPYRNLDFVNRRAHINLSYLNILSEITSSEVKNNQKPKDVFERMDEVALNMQSIYQDLGFLEGEYKEKNNKLISNDPFLGRTGGSFKEKLILLSRLFKQSRKLLGDENESKYLIVLQDDKELRATGGKIRALAVLTFSKGKVVNQVFFDTKFADAKLGGTVEPPDALAKHLNVISWYLEEANWYSDFPSTAEKVEWFLDKEMDLKLDGVIAINASAIHEMVEFAEMNVSGGWDTKASGDNYFTIYLKAFLEAISTVSPSQKAKLFVKSIELLERREITAFTHIPETNYLLNDIGWDGSVSSEICESQSCFSDIFGVSETTIHGTNENIARKMDFDLSFEENLLKREVFYYIENRSERDYLTYLRFILDPNSGVSPAIIMKGDKKETKDLDISGFKGYKEAGLLVEVPKMKTVAVGVLWESGFIKDRIETYSLKLRNPPGINGVSVNLSVAGADLSKAVTQPLFSLTDEGKLIYNTTLQSDLDIKIASPK